MRRILAVTARGLVVAAAIVSVGGPVAAGGDAETSAAGKDLRVVAKRDAPLDDRIAAARRAAAARGTGDVDGALRAAGALLADAPGNPLALAAVEALVRAARDEDVPSDDALAAVRSTPERFLRGEGQDGLGPATDLMLACGFAAGMPLQGAREAEALVRLRDDPLVRDAVRAGAPSVASAWARGETSADAAARAFAAEALLDRASRDDPRESRPALDALLAAARGGDADVLRMLLEVAAPGEAPTAKGRVPRRVRAVVALGLAGKREATPALVRCLDDKQDGWVRVAAADALGDLGDPSAVAALCHVLFYLGDVHRPRDSWDYPGDVNFDVPPEQWNDVEYFAVDVASANALLSLGVREAAPWLLRERLAVSTGRWRIRVLQDAVDALRRHFPKAPRGYQPDAGLPDRDRAWRDLVAWWATGPRLAHPLDEGDPAFAEAAKEIVARIGQKSVMELQIAKRSAGLVGAPMTPFLLTALAASTSRVARAEIAAVLGDVRDRRAVGPLLALTHDDAPNVRGAAAEALAPYVDGEDDPRFDGAEKDVLGRTLTRWIELLSDEEESPRASALKGLVSAPPRDDVRAAVLAHASATHADNAFSDYQIAEEVVLLVQTGEGLEMVFARLTAPDLFVRRAAWEHLVRALRLDGKAFDPQGDPPPAPAGGGAAVPKLDVAAVRAALGRRRTR